MGEYALHHLFTAFGQVADRKIQQCLNDSREGEVRTETICGPGVDPDLDQLISALGHISRQHPKPLIDTLMLWRRSKSDAANESRANFEKAKAAAAAATTNPLIPPSYPEPTLKLQAYAIEHERRSTISIYFLCRVLTEVFSQSTLEAVTPEIADRLEDIVYKQLASTDPDYIDESPPRQSNWIIFGQLLGQMSEMDFEHVVPRFIFDLRRMQLGNIRRDGIENRAVMVVKGMRWIRLKRQPEAAWQQTCEFLNQLATLAINAHGQMIKYAFIDIFKELLLPIAAEATSEVNVPQWVSIIAILKPKLTTMLAKPKHFLEVFPAMVVVLCASPREAFASQWLSLISPLAQRLREPRSRVVAIRGICRLVWTYCFRISDPNMTAVRNITDIIKLVFVPGRKSFIGNDHDVVDPLIQLIRIIGYKYRELCMRSIIWPMMNSDLFSSGREVRINDVEPEKIVIAIRAFLAIMSDLENGEQPPYPIDFDAMPASEPFRFSTIPMSPRSPMDLLPRSTLVREERLSRPVLVSGFDASTMETYAKFCKVLGEITIFCDNTFGGQAVLDEKFSNTPKTPITDAFSFSRRDDHSSQVDYRQAFYDLLHVAVQALPRCLNSDISFKALVNLLCTGTAHVQSNIASSSVQSLKSIAKQGHAQQVTVGFARFIFNFDDRYSTMSDGGMLGHDHIESTLQLYVELLHIWIEEIKLKQRRVLSPDENSPTARGANLDMSGLWAQVDEVESHGLFFLCSPSRRVRSFAVTVLRLVLEFDTALGKDSQRVIRIMEGRPDLILDANDEKLSVAERSRVQKALKKTGDVSPVVELCSSDAGYDSTLWFKIFPNLVRLSADMCPVSAILTRDIVCARISQMQKAVSSLADGPRPYAGYSSAIDLTATRPGIASTHPEMLIEQWKLYLIFACTTLTNLGDMQKAGATNHTRSGSKPSPSDKIQSARELFARIIPFLGVPNHSVRAAVVIGLGTINLNLYRTLLEALHPAVTNCSDAARSLLANNRQGMTSPRRLRRSHTDYLRTEIAGVYKLTSRFLKLPEVHNDEWMLNNLVSYTQDLRIFPPRCRDST